LPHESRSTLRANTKKKKKTAWFPMLRRDARLVVFRGSFFLVFFLVSFFFPVPFFSLLFQQNFLASLAWGGSPREGREEISGDALLIFKALPAQCLRAAWPAAARRSKTTAPRKPY